MPCSARARGIANPTVLPPFTTPATPSVPFNDVIDNDPCGKPIVATVDAVDMSMHQLCLGHLALKLGLASVRGQIGNEPALLRTTRPGPKTKAKKTTSSSRKR